MTCFRMPTGETVHQWCIKNNVPYNSFWNRMEEGLSFYECIVGAQAAKGRGRAHPKYFYRGKPLTYVCGGYNTISYNRVFRKIRRGIPVEEALKLSGVI